MTDPTPAILSPEADLQLAGEVVTVQEFSFLQGLRLQGLAGPLLEDMNTCLEEKADLSLERLGELFALHETTMLHLIATAIDKPVDWVKGLNDGEGQQLLLTFWTVNSGFFVRRLLTNRAAAATENLKTSSMGA